MTAYYNEIEPYAAQWLRNLIAAGHIAPGEVDERSIREVQPDDLRGFTQCHFFAGIGVWSHALRCAGVSDDYPVWTGSPPCQPFSAAGRRKGAEDDRHLWPELFRLVSQCRPPLLLGEQVASKDGLAWLDTVQADLEGANYAATAFDLCAAGVGAPHIRQRLFFVGMADAASLGRREEREDDAGSPVGDPAEGVRPGPDSGGAVVGMGNTDEERREGLRVLLRERRSYEDLSQAAGHGEGEPGSVNGHWAGAEWVACGDPRGARWRPIEPGSCPLADGAPNRVGRLRAYGNAIVAPVATEFIRAVLSCSP